MMLNMEFERRVMINTNDPPWQSSPASGVWRKPLAREDAERGHATSIVRYDRGGSFPRHEHASRRMASAALPVSRPAFRRGFGAARVAEVLKRTLLLVAVAVLSGCAATNIQRAEQLGALGKAYADAVTAAGDEALLSVTAFSLEEIRKERKGGAFRTPAEREEAINDEIDRLKKRQTLVADSDAQVALLGEYFASLQQFAKQDVAGSVETATAGLTGGINRLGVAIENNPQAKARLSEPERTAIAKLAGLVAREVHGQALSRILERDAKMIGTQLTLLAKVLATYAEWIGARNDMEIEQFYRQNVVKPFAAAGDLPAGWDKDVRTYLRGSDLAVQLGKAQAAGQRMERFWAGYLAGDTSIGEVVASLKEVQSLLDAVSAYRKARAGG
jgi:hypothetical protein